MCLHVPLYDTGLTKKTELFLTILQNVLDVQYTVTTNENIIVQSKTLKHWEYIT